MAKQVTVGVKVDPLELESWRLTAAAQGKSVPMWLRGLGNGACGPDPLASRLKKDKEVATKILAEPAPDDAALNALPADEPDIPYEQSSGADDGPTHLGSDLVVVDIPCPPPVSMPEPVIAPKLRPGFTRPPKCTSSKCERFQSPACDLCRHANAESVEYVQMRSAEEAYIAPKPWATGKRSPKCITKKCASLGAPACDPCRQFNARGFEF